MADKQFHKVVYVKDFEVHIVPDRSQYDYVPYRDPAKGVAGYASEPNKIFILGKEHNGKVYVDDLFNLGHELQHVLRFNDIEVIDSHDYDWWMKR
jgi:hypothetical protein